MFKKTSTFDDFVFAPILADIFDPSGSKDIDFVSRKIVDALDANGMIKNHDLNNEENLAV